MAGYRNPRSTSIEQGWQLASLPPGACANPEQLEQFAPQWRDAVVPGTAAQSMNAGMGTTVDAAIDYDADDWWYRTRFESPPAAATSGAAAASRQARHVLCFDGLATIAQVWLNGREILASQNMFVASRVDVTEILGADNVLHIAFRSLRAALGQRRPRPRWKTALVEEQNLRWFRTTLLGRIPAWSPPVATVGPWQGVFLERIDAASVEQLDLSTGADNEGPWLRLRAGLSGGAAVEGARLRVGEHVHELQLDIGNVRDTLIRPDAPLWWPHTHGEPALVPCSLELKTGGEWQSIDCGRVGFKRVEIDQSGGGVRFKVNGADVFCRGACWTTLDMASLRGSPEELRRALETARDAGANMLRIGGTMAYESDEFYRLCDELGIMVWQDFMFANMDYPFGDAQFLANVETEVRQQLARLGSHACVAAYCGGSEVAQQAAMLGLPASEWCHEFFSAALPRHIEELHTGIPYFPSTPWGGALPFHVGTGISHYYGVGAYRRPFSDARSARVRFTSECLGFSNVPDAALMDKVFGGAIAPHHPRWKARLPRDNGPGWDFEDIRDHYLGLLFGSDAVELRSVDVSRYYALSRVTSGEVMQRVFSEWRRLESTCGGGLVWFYRDLWPGAGWGLTDSTGGAKAALWYLKRAWAPQAIRITDEGLDGLAIHLINERAEALSVEVEFQMFQSGRTPTGSAKASVDIPARGATSLSGDALLGYFSDSTSAYRFGPPKQDVVVARMKRRDDGAVLGEDFYFPTGLALAPQRSDGVKCAAQWESVGGQSPDTVSVVLGSDVFLQSVCVSSPGALPSDNYFHVAPGQEKRILFTLTGPATRGFKAEFEALNLHDAITTRLQREA